jgi:hypothetical protein
MLCFILKFLFHPSLDIISSYLLRFSCFDVTDTFDDTYSTFDDVNC